MPTFITRFFQRLRLTLLIWAERPDLWRLYGLRLLQHYADDQRAQRQRQDSIFEDSLRDPEMFDGLLCYPASPSPLLQQVEQYLEPKPVDVPFLRKTIHVGFGDRIVAQEGPAYVVAPAISTPKPKSRGPLEQAVSHLNFLRRRLAAHYQSVSQGDEHLVTGAEDYLLSRIAEQEKEVERLTRQRFNR